jgi:NitT/TauT family transport system substrate-binding protein
VKVRRRAWGIFLMLSLVIAGCGGRAASDPSAVPASVKAEKVRIGVAGQGALAYAQLTLAKELGMFKDEGLDVEIENFQGGGAQSVQALVGGSIEFVAGTMDHAIRASMQKQSIKMVALFTRTPGFALVVDSKYKDQIKQIEDLKGKQLGVSSLGSSTHMVLSIILKQHGLDPAKDVQIVKAGLDTFHASIASGSIIGGMVAEPYLAPLLQAGTVYVLSDLHKIQDTRSVFQGEYPGTGLLTHGNVIKDKPELTARVVRALVHTNKWLSEHKPEDVAKAMPKELQGRDPAVYLAAVKNAWEQFSPDGLVKEQDAARMLEATGQFDEKVAGANIVPSTLFDMTFVNKALGH